MLKKIPKFEIELSNVPLQFVHTYKYLGVTPGSQVTYNLHVNKVIGSVSAKLKQFKCMSFFKCQCCFNGLQEHIVTDPRIW